MLDPDHQRLMEHGALIVGVVTADGAPYATRAWGLSVVDPGGAAGELCTVRVLLGDDDLVALEASAPGRAVAVTVADVPTLRSAQLKGRSLGTEAADDEDRERSAEYFRRFSADVARADGQPPELLGRLVPHGLVACTVVVDEAYDQTPGPRAGSGLGPP